MHLGVVEQSTDWPVQPELRAGPGPGAADLVADHLIRRAAQCRHLGLHPVGLLDSERRPSGVGEERARRPGPVVGLLPNGQRAQELGHTRTLPRNGQAVFQGPWRQPVGLVDDEQVDVGRPAAEAQPGVVAMDVLVDASLDPGEQLVEVAVELSGGVGGGRGVEDGAGAGEGGVDRVVAVLVRAPLLEQRLGGVPGGVAAGGQRLADTGRA